MVEAVAVPGAVPPAWAGRPGKVGGRVARNRVIDLALSAAAAAALVAFGLPALEGDDAPAAGVAPAAAADASSLPGLEEIAAIDPATVDLDDGYQHLILDPGDDTGQAGEGISHPEVQPGPTPTTTPTTTPSTAAPTTAPATATAPAPTTAALPAALPADQVLGADALAALGDVRAFETGADGRVVAVLADGSRVALDGSSVSPPTDPGPPPLPETPATDAPAPPDPGEEAVLLAGGGGDGEVPAALAALADDPGTRELVPVGDGTWALTTTRTAAEVEALTGLPTVEDPPLALSTDDTYWAWQWAAENDGRTIPPTAGVVDADIDLTDAWTQSTGTGVVVAVVDTGIDFTHPELVGRRWSNADEQCGDGDDDDANGFVDDCFGWDFRNNDAQPYDAAADNAHGTHVAGIVAAARGNGAGVAGVAPDATIMSLKIAEPSIRMSDAARAIRYAVDNGADVINASFGTVGTVTLAQVSSLVSAVDHAADRGVIVVAAAGNSNQDIEAAPTYPASLSQANVITVGASDNDDRRASFSNWGLASVDLFAPGRYIISPVPGGQYAAMNGTSMAAPEVAGVVALLLAADPTADVATVRQALLEGGDQVSAFTGISTSGRRLNAAGALTRLGAGPLAPVPTGVVADFTGLTGGTPSAPLTPTVSLTVDDPALLGGATFDVEATLLTVVGGQVFGVVDHPVTVDGQPGTTDAAARRTLAAGLSVAGEPALSAAGVTRALSLTLPAGSYALVVEAVDAGGVVLGDASVVFFAVGAGATTTTTSGGATTTTAAGGGTTTTTGAGGPTTTTAAPGGGAVTTSTLPQVGGGGGGGGATTSTTRATTTTTGGGDGGATTSTLPQLGGGGGGATTSTTRATTTTIGGGGGGGTTTTQAGATPGPTIAPVVSGSWRLDAISPAYAYVPGGSGAVVLSGRFPSVPYVWFGDVAVAPSSASVTQLVVSVPARATPGAVDVSLRVTGQGEVLRAAAAFRYLSPAPGATQPSTTTAPHFGGGGATTTTAAPAGPGATTTTTAAGGATTTTAAGGGAPTTTTAAAGGGGGATTTTAPATTTTTAAVAIGPARVRLGAPATLPSGLRAAPVTTSGPLAVVHPTTWAARTCTADPCRAARP
jgi:serine protease